MESKNFFDLVREQVKLAAEELISQAKPAHGEIFVVGCSTSEIMGKMIGQGSSEDAACAVMETLLPIVSEHGLFLAVQCCEHLNRALVVEAECAQKYDFTEVNVIPQLHAGGALSMQAVKHFSEHVMVEDIHGRAALGMDIGDTFIGMHLRPVVVPIHTTHKNIGHAHLTMARTRRKFVGGERAVYEK